jgi:oligopeptide/dipeptide ABC transporter ATP-binding protein
MASIPNLDEEKEFLNTIKGVIPAPNEMPNGCRFHPRCSIADESCCGENPVLKEYTAGHKVRCWKAAGNAVCENDRLLGGRGQSG